MAYSHYSNVTDELLSAYIDGAVTASERALVEEAVANDQRVARRLETLRHTVALLGQLADVPLPRSFTLNEALLTAPAASMTASRPDSRETPARQSAQMPSLLERWQTFWGSGNVLWRNAAAVCALLLLLILVGDNWTTQQSTISQTTMTTAGSGPTAATASDVAAAQEVAMAPAGIDTESSDAAATTPAAEVAVERVEAEAAAPVDATAVVEPAAAMSAAFTADVNDSVTDDDAALGDESVVEAAQVELASPAQNETATGGQPEMAAPSTPAEGSVSPLPRSANPSNSNEVEENSLSAASLAITVMAPSVITASLAAPQAVSMAAPVPESPLAVAEAPADDRVDSVAQPTEKIAESPAAEAGTVGAEDPLEAQTPADSIEASAPLETPAAVALAEETAETLPSAPVAGKASVASDQATASSPWRTAVLASQAALALLLLFFVLLWLRSRSKHAA